MNKKQIACVVVTAIVFLGIGMSVGAHMDKRGYKKEKMEQGMHMMHDMDMSKGKPDMKAAMDGMMAGISGKTGVSFDAAFLSGMIVHHQGAVAMAEALLKTSKRPELIQLANDIIKAQNAEIEMMKKWQAEWVK